MRRAEKRSAFRRTVLSHDLQMPDYRRYRVPGASYFFTVNLLDRGSDLLVRQIDLLRDAVRSVRRRRPFHIDAWVVLPDHMHCLWTLPEDDSDFPGRWRAIKIGFSKSLSMTESRSAVMIRRGERGIWQRRYWEHMVRDNRDYAAHMDYIHFNPVKHGLVEEPSHWPFSTFPQCVAAVLYPEDWLPRFVEPSETGE
jgi:putative transposase